MDSPTLSQTVTLSYTSLPSRRMTYFMDGPEVLFKAQYKLFSTNYSVYTVCACLCTHDLPANLANMKWFYVSLKLLTNMSCNKCNTMLHIDWEFLHFTCSSVLISSQFNAYQHSAHVVCDRVTTFTDSNGKMRIATHRIQECCWPGNKGDPKWAHARFIRSP